MPQSIGGPRAGEIAAARIVLEAVRGRAAPTADADRPPPPALLGLLGAGIGLLSGLTGVGGGVFLTPVLLAIRAAPVKRVAAVTAPFILVNSLAGLAGGSLPPLSLPALGAVVLGGTIGSQLGAVRLPATGLRLLMAVVLLVAAGTLIGGTPPRPPAAGAKVADR